MFKEFISYSSYDISAFVHNWTLISGTETKPSKGNFSKISISVGEQKCQRIWFEEISNTLLLNTRICVRGCGSSHLRWFSLKLLAQGVAGVIKVFWIHWVDGAFYFGM